MDNQDITSKTFISPSNPQNRRSDLNENGVLPPEAKLNYEALDNSNTMIPGDIEIDDQGALLKSFIDYSQFTKDLIDGYDYWIMNILPQQIVSRSIKTPFLSKDIVPSNKEIVFHRSLRIIRPQAEPRECRNKNLTYSIEIQMAIGYLTKDPKTDAETVTPIKEGPNNVYVSIGKIPLMLGSTFCYTRNKTDEQLLKMGECPDDPRGYFIVKGAEKVVVIQEKLRTNRFFVYYGDNKMVGKTRAISSLVARMTCPIKTKNQLVLLKMGVWGNIRLVLDFFGKTPSKEPNSVDVLQPLRIIGEWIDSTAGLRNEYGSYEQIMKRILSMTDQNPKYQTRLEMALRPSYNKVLQINTIDPYIYMNRKFGFPLKSPALESQILNNLFNDLFPQVSPDNPLFDQTTPVDLVIRKYEMLCYFIAQLLEVIAGVKDPDDRDSWGNKSLATAASEMQQLFNCSFRKSMDRTEEEISKLNTTGVAPTMIRSLFKYSGEVTDTFIRSFNTANWGCKGAKPRNGVTEILSRNNILAAYANMRKINAQGNRKAKQPHIRLLKFDQTGYICPIETPEGQNCGLVKNLAVGANISIEENPLPIYFHLQANIKSRSSAVHTTKFILNGIFMGWCDGIQTYKRALESRRLRKIGIQTAIVLQNDSKGNPSTLYIYCDGSRPVRPLLVVGNGIIPLIGANGDYMKDTDGNLILSKPGILIIEQLINIENKNFWRESTFNELILRGCIEYIDAFEQHYIYLAPSINAMDNRQDQQKYFEKEYQIANDRYQEVKGGKKIEIDKYLSMKYAQAANPNAKELSIYLSEEDAENEMRNMLDALNEIKGKHPYTHCEMDPSAILGISASTIPMPDRNAAARNVFQCGQAKQALSIFHSNHHDRFDTTDKVLAFPSRPLFEPQMLSLMGANRLPAVENVVIAVAPWRGWNQEDAFVFNKGAIDRGLFKYIKYTTKKAVERKFSGSREEFKKPILKPGEPSDAYDNIGDDGLPFVGSRMERGQCVIGKVMTSRSEKNAEVVEKDASVTIGIGEEGIVDRVMITKNDEGMEVVKVKIRNLRTPEVGDKFSSRYAQKGTIGKIVDESLMPRISGGLDDGLPPSIIISPKSFISRMTVGMWVEIAASKNAAFTGERVNASAFRPFDYDELDRNLQQYGFKDYGTEKMIDGVTGREMPCRVYSGICAYQALKHHVKDKIQARALGPISETSHQPVGGRSRTGGQRVGCKLPKSTVKRWLVSGIGGNTIKFRESPLELLTPTRS